MAVSKEIAKFLCGAEAFHTVVHTYFWLSGTTLTTFMVLSPTGGMIAAIVNAVISILLGIYAWRKP